MNRTLVILKPDAVERGLVGEITARFEKKGLRIAAMELRHIERAVAEVHYAEHAQRPFFAELVEFITRSPVIVAVLEGPADTWAIVRTMMGATNPAEAPPGTIRGDLASQLSENLIHGSDSAASAAREIALFFPSLA